MWFIFAFMMFIMVMLMSVAMMGAVRMFIQHMVEEMKRMAGEAREGVGYEPSGRKIVEYNTWYLVFEVYNACKDYADITIYRVVTVDGRRSEEPYSVRTLMPGEKTVKRLFCYLKKYADGGYEVQTWRVVPSKSCVYINIRTERG